MSLAEDKQQLISDRNRYAVDYAKYTKPKQTLTLTVLGDKGSGKTLFMCIIAMMFNSLKKEFYTNFSMDKELVPYSRDFNIKNLYNNPNVEGIFLDEMHNIADQNSNHTLETQLLVALFTQSRKRNQIIILSSLMFYKLAKDLRHLTNIIVYPEYDIKEDTLKVVFWDFRTDLIAKRTITNVSKFFKYYNTYEIIVSDKIKGQLAQFMLKNKKLQSEIKKKLDINEQDMLDNIEGRLKNE